MKYIGYCRVSTREQGVSGLGLEAQEHAITMAATVAPWSVAEFMAEVGSGSKAANRPLLQRALAMCQAGEADGIVVARLDRLSRSLTDFAALLALARAKNFNVVALDLGVDLSTPAGELVANVMASVAQWQLRSIQENTKEGLAAARARGVRLGAAPAIEADLAARIRGMRAEGSSLRAVCAALNGEGVPTPRGGLVWRPSSLASVVRAGA